MKSVGAGGVAGLGGLAGCAGGGSSGQSGSSGGSDSSGGSSGSGTTSSSGGGETLRSMGAVSNLVNPYWASYIKGYNEASKALGYEPQVSTFDGSIDQLMQQVDSALAQDIDLISADPLTDAAAPQVAEAAVNAGIPVSMSWQMGQWTTPFDIGLEYVHYNTPNSINVGYRVSKMLFEAMGGSGNFVHLEGLPGNKANSGRNTGLKQAMEEYPDINQLGQTISGNWTKKAGREGMSDFVTQFGDEIDGVMPQNDSQAVGALKILKEQGMEEVKIVGVDGVPEGLQAVADGDLVCSHASHGPWQGGWNVVMCHNYRNGWEPKAPERMMVSGGSLIVQDPSDFSEYDIPTIRADNYLQNVYEADTTPWDWEKMSVVEAGEDSWDPQNNVRPVRRDELTTLLTWGESERPSGYQLPSHFDNSDLINEVETMYDDHYQTNPFA